VASLNQIVNHIVINAGDNEDKNTTLPTLLAEVAELAYALEGRHEHPPEHELIQIAGICINWLRRLTSD